MIPSHEKDGYNWKCTIDLGKATSANLCFNNGSTWDNNNHKNYVVNAGVTGIKNGKIEELSMSAKLVTDKEIGGIHGTTTVTAEITNGVAPYRFSFAATDGTSVETEGNSFSYLWNTNQQGDFVLNLRVVDATGAETVVTTFYTVEGMKWEYFKADAQSPQKVDTEIELSAKMKNVVESENNTYRFMVNGKYLDNVDQTKGTVIWKPTVEGTYLLTAEFTDYMGVKYTTNMEYEILKESVIRIYYANSNWSEAYIHYKVDGFDWTEAPGYKMIPSNKEGYQFMLDVDLRDAYLITFCFNNGKGSWDSKNGKNYLAGRYYCVGVKNQTLYRFR